MAAVPGGVIGATSDGHVFRHDHDGRRVWHVRLHVTSLAADSVGERLLLGTDAGDVQVHARTGEVIGRSSGKAVRAAAFLANGDRVLTGERGTLQVLGGDGSLRWSWRQPERPERLWVQGGRVYLAGEGGLKEIVVGQGVVCRWPSDEAVTAAVVAGGTVFTCGRHVRQFGYATAADRGQLPDLPTPPRSMTLLKTGGPAPGGPAPGGPAPGGRTSTGSDQGGRWLLVAYGDGKLAAWRLAQPQR